MLFAVLFCCSAFSQDEMTLQYLEVLGNGTSNVDAPCLGGNYNIPVCMNASYTGMEDILVEIYNEKLMKIGYDGFIVITNLYYDFGLSRSVLTFQILPNSPGGSDINFRIKGSNGGYSQLYQETCAPPLPPPPPPAQNPIISDVSDGNWIIKTTHTDESGTQYFRDITYYDGLGYPEQVIQIEGSPSKKNIITPVYYDNMRRDNAKVYLPYVSENSTAAREASPFTAQPAFYEDKFNAADAEYAYVENIFEASPLNRILHTVNVGNTYRINDKKSENNYGTNLGDEVFLLNVNPTNNSLNVAGYYAANTLYKNSVINEDSAIIITYTDKLGQNILTRTIDDNNQNYDTYYAYDNKGQVSWVISPEGSDLLTVNTTLTTDNTTIAQKYCYTYKYDGRGNVIERRMPGKQVEYMIYDKAGRLVLSQDGNLHENNQWIYNVYDNVNNITDVTLVQSTLARDIIQAKYYASGFNNNYNSLGESYSIYCPFEEENNFDTEYLISSTRYMGKSYYVRNNLSSGTYLRYNSATNATSSGSVYGGNGMIEIGKASIDISGISIKPPKTSLPDGYTILDPGRPLDPDDEPEEPEEPEGPDCPGIPFDPEPENPEIPLDCTTCDPFYLYTINDVEISIKDEHLVYTDANNPNIKYYAIPSQYMNIAECIASCDPAYSIFIGMPEQARTITWETSPLAFEEVANVCDSSGLETQNIKHLKSYEIIKILADSSEYVERAFYYDYLGRVIQTVERNHLGKISRYSTKYDFVGNILAQHESHQIDSVTIDIKLTKFAYDHRGRLLNDTTSLNNGIAATVNYAYNELGQLIEKEYGNETKETTTYNIQGWVTEKATVKMANNENIFNMQLSYYSPNKQNTTPSYTGNITEWTWKHGTDVQNTYAFTYDKLNRLTDNLRYTGNSNTSSNTFTEQGIDYDKNGNILTLQRYDGAASLQDDLIYSYNGNQLTALSGTTNASYIYDNNGNMNYDGRKNINIEYNLLNLAHKVMEGSQTKATYTYIADGTKAEVKDDTENGFVYLGSMVYNKNSGNLELESTGFGSGRINKTSGNYDINYFITDHLGSTRVIVDNSGTIKEQNDYYPFGMRYQSNSGSAISTNRYTFSGKEIQTTGNVNYLDFGARQYDEFLGRWLAQDPLQELKPWVGSYVYCFNNPLKYIDPDGMAEWEFSYRKMKIGNQTFEVAHWERVTDTGDDIGVDFYHTNEKIEDEDGSSYQKTFVIDKQGNWNTIKNGRQLLQGGVKRKHNTNWFDIFSEWHLGYGPELSVFEGDHPAITDGILKDGAYLFKYMKFLDSNKPKDSPNNYFIPLIDNLAAGFNMQLQMMGSYNLSFYQLGDRVLSIAADEKSLKSWSLHLFESHNRTPNNLMQGTTKQVYIFFAPQIQK